MTPAPLFARLWRLRLRTAILLALPLQVAAVAFCWHAHEQWRAGRALADKTAVVAIAEGRPDPRPPFDLEQWRFQARDTWRRLLARLFSSSPPGDGLLPSFHLDIDSDKVAALDRDLPESGKSDTKKAQVVTPEGSLLPVKARYLGDNHWHWLYPQKSWRLKLRRGATWHGRRLLTFKNPPSMLTIDEPLVTRVARSIGLLAPEVEPVQLFVNGDYRGLYLRWDVADESLLRNQRRMPGSIYSGDGAPTDPATGVSSLFADARFWQKDASRNAEREADRGDIEQLLGALAASDPLAFAAFAERHLDLEQFARFVALDRAFASVHHDYHHNHKLYVDPYRGRFEPIVWDVNDWMVGAGLLRFDLTLNPLLIALRTVPTFELRMQRTLHELLQRQLRPGSVAAGLDELDRVTHAARVADAHRDRRDYDSGALQFTLTQSTRYTMREYHAALQALVEDYTRRHAILQALLGDCRLALRHEPIADGLRLELVSYGRVAAEWAELSCLRTDAGDGVVELIADSNRNGRLDPDDRVVAGVAGGDGQVHLAPCEVLFPALGERPFAGGSPQLFGHVDLTPTPQVYGYFLRGVTADAVTGLSAKFANAVTGAAVDVVPQRPPTLWAPPADRVASCHPWDLPTPQPPRTETLGPGEVHLDETLELGAETTLEIVAGTTVLLAGDVSILCRGRLRCLGTAEQPIHFRPARDDAPWGCLALQGAGAAGSRLRHCTFVGGSAVDFDLLQCTGMVNIGDTRDIVVERCEFGANARGDDAMHWAYVVDGDVLACAFEGVPSDALDLDLCDDVTVAECRFTGCGNDGVDLMSCRATIRACVFERCGDKGASVGEGSELELLDCRAIGCAIGVQIKDESRVRADRFAARDCPVGVSLLHKNRHYRAEGWLTADALYFENVGRALDRPRGFVVEAKAIYLDGVRQDS